MHIGILIGTESLVRHDPRLIVLVGLAIAAEFVAAFILIGWQQANFVIARPATEAGTIQLLHERHHNGTP